MEIEIKSEYNELAKSVTANTKIVLKTEVASLEDAEAQARLVDSINQRLFNEALLFSMQKSSDKSR